MNRKQNYRVAYRIEESYRVLITAKPAKHAADSIHLMLEHGLPIASAGIIHAERDVCEVEEVRP